MLGTNDIKYANRCRAFDAAMGMGRLVEIVQCYPWIKTASPPQVLIMSPPALCKTNDEWFNDLWGHAIEESKLFAKHYSRVAEEMGVHFFDAGSVAKTDPTDGGHLDANEHSRHWRSAGAGGEEFGLCNTLPRGEGGEQASRERGLPATKPLSRFAGFARSAPSPARGEG